MNKPELREVDALLVGFDNVNGDITTLIVGRKRPNQSIDIINALQGDEAKELYERLVKPKKGGVRMRTKIKNVIFNDPATIVFWQDGTKTVVKCHDGAFDPEKGLAMAISKKALGNKYDYYEEFEKWLPNKKEFDDVGSALRRLSDALRSIDLSGCIPKRIFPSCDVTPNTKESDDVTRWDYIKLAEEDKNADI